MSVNFESIYEEAHNEGLKAVEGLYVVPMIVEEHASPFDDNSPVKKQYYVSDGVCGFAEVRFKGNTAWGRWAKKQGIARSSYSGGLYIWISDFNQSYQKKMAYAGAFAQKLREYDIEAYASGRLD